MVLAADCGATRVVLKQALPQLRVKDLWLAKRERAISEADALVLAKTITPDAVPTVLDVDRERCALTIAAAPAELGDVEEPSARRRRGPRRRRPASATRWRSGTARPSVTRWSRSDSLTTRPSISCASIHFIARSPRGAQSWRRRSRRSWLRWRPPTSAWCTATSRRRMCSSVTACGSSTSRSPTSAIRCSTWPSCSTICC